MLTSSQTLLNFEDALHMSREEALEIYRQHLNPRLTNMLAVIGADAPASRAANAHVFDAEGRCFVDFSSAFGSLNLGHNPKRIEAAVDRVRECENVILGGVSPLMGALACNLVQLAPTGLTRVNFTNSGAEAVDVGVKLARAATRRPKLVACAGGFHGRTIGALSLMDRRDFRTNFEPLLSGVEFVRFGDIDALEAALGKGDIGGFIFEPVQGEAGMVVPPPGYLRAAQEICRTTKTLFIADEVQTGFGRTGRMFAVEHEGLEPDVLILGKGLGGGIVPISATLTRESVWKSAGGGTPRSPFQTPTYGGHTRACAAALATIDALIEEDLPARAAALGERLLLLLRDLQARQPLIADVRGRGLMIGIEFAPVTTGLATAITGGVLNRLSREYFCGLVMIELRKRGYIAFLTANNPNVLRLQPPLTIEPEHIDGVVEALEDTLREIVSFPRALFQSWQLLFKAMRA